MRYLFCFLCLIGLMVPSGDLLAESETEIAELMESALEVRREKPELFKGAGGVLVTDILTDSQGKKAGMHAGDVIISYDGKAVNAPEDLIRFTSEKPESETVSLELIRNGESRTLDLQGGKIGVAIRPLTSAAELSVHNFIQGFIQAAQEDDAQKMVDLARKNPVTAVQVRDLLLGKADEGVENAEGMKLLAALIERYLLKENLMNESVMNRLREEGEQAYYRSDYATAIEKYQQGLDMAQKSGNRTHISQFITNKGIIYSELGQYDKALSHFQQALAIHREIGNRRREGSILTNMGVVYDNLGQYDKALSHNQQALAIHREIGDRQSEGANLTTMGMVYGNLGQYDKALPYFRQALAIHREIGDRQGEGGDLNNIGLYFWNLGQYDKALSHFQQALEIQREISNLRGESNNLTNMGVVYDSQGQYEKALSHYQQALAIKREIGDRRGEGNNLNNMGEVCINVGQYDKALSRFQQGLAVHREIGNRRGESDILGGMGRVYTHLGQYDKAISHSQQALAIKREIGDVGGEGGNLTTMGVVFQNLGQYDKALFHYQQALAIAREMGNRRGESGGLANMGVVFQKMDQYLEAVVHYQQALAILQEIGDRRGEGSVLTNMGLIYDYLGQYDKALSHSKQALAIKREIGDRLGEGVILSNMGLVYSNLLQYDKAEQTFLEGLTTCKEVGALRYLWLAQRGLASVAVKLNRGDDAVLHYEEALNTIETMREGITEKEAKTGFMQNKIYVYDELIALLQSLQKKRPKKGYAKKSIQIFERKQGRVFLEEMGQSGARNFAGIPESLLNQEDEFYARLATLRKRRADEGAKSEQDRNMDRIRELEAEIETVQAEQQRLQETVQSDYPDYHALKYPQPVSLPELRQTVLQPGETLLIYNVMEETTALWVVNRGHFSLHTINIAQDDLAEKITRYRNLAIAPSGRDLRGRPVPVQSTERPEIPDLYDLLIPETVRPVLSSAQRLYVIPTGPLYLLPFETLQDETDRYLIERHPVAYLSSASLLKILREAQGGKKESPTHPLLAFADPVYGESHPDDNTLRGLRTESYRAIMDGNFAPLPETEDEVRAIQTILNAPDESRPLWLEAEASRSNIFKLNESRTLDDYRYLVFACHGILPGEINRVTQPALVLSDPDPQTRENGFLTMADVFGLSLNADLVTLSACNTGRGQSVQGEGVMGLTRAFMYAGTPAISVTLWSVESMSAKTLNVGFFRNLKAGKGRAEALREIKLAMLRGDNGEEWKKPYYWAPVVVFGDGN